MYLKIWIISLATVLADHGEFKSCFQCHAQSKKYCRWDPTGAKGACCKEGSESLYCQETENNKCTPLSTYNRQGTAVLDDFKYFTYCNKITKNLCKTEADDMKVTPTQEK